MHCFTATPSCCIFPHRDSHCMMIAGHLLCSKTAYRSPIGGSVFDLTSPQLLIPYAAPINKVFYYLILLPSIKYSTTLCCSHQYSILLPYAAPINKVFYYLMLLPSIKCSTDRKSTRLNSSHSAKSRMPSSA